MHQNAFAARALPRTPPGELTALPQSSSWIWWEGVGKGGERKGRARKRERRKGKGREGVSQPNKNSGYGLDLSRE